MELLWPEQVEVRQALLSQRHLLVGFLPRPEEEPQECEEQEYASHLHLLVEKL